MTRAKVHLMTFFCIVFVSFYMAQNDSITKQKRKVKVLVGLDANRSFVLKTRAKFGGIRVGVEVEKRYRFGLSVHGMQEPLEFDRTIDSDKFPNANNTLKLKFSYTTLFYEHIWLTTKRWELSTPFHTGGGEVLISYKDTIQNKEKQVFKGASSVLFTSIASQYKITRWLALGTGLGYRFVFSKDKKVSAGLNAPVYVFKVKVLMGELIKKWFKKDYHNSDWD